MIFQNVRYTPLTDDSSPIIEDIVVTSDGTVEAKGGSKKSPRIFSMSNMMRTTSLLKYLQNLLQPKLLLRMLMAQSIQTFQVFL